MRNQPLTAKPAADVAEHPAATDCYRASERLLLGQYHVQTSGRDAELMAKDRYLAADGFIRIYDAASKLIAAIDAADASEGHGDRVVTEDDAISRLREQLAR